MHLRWVRQQKGSMKKANTLFFPAHNELLIGQNETCFIKSHFRSFQHLAAPSLHLRVFLPFWPSQILPDPPSSHRCLASPAHQHRHSAAHRRSLQSASLPVPPSWERSVIGQIWLFNELVRHNTYVDSQGWPCSSSFTRKFGALRLRETSQETWTHRATHARTSDHHAKRLKIGDEILREHFKDELGDKLDRTSWTAAASKFRQEATREH